MKKKDNQSSWFNFYFDRVDSAEYTEYFKNKYSLLVGLVKSFLTCGLIKEEGIGIGSLAKVIGSGIYGSDICTNMLSLCRLNNPGIQLFREDIIDAQGKKYLPDTFAVVTHGVLEHFDDHNILKILNSYHTHVNFSIHYVPTDKYEKPSFGDERLLSTTYWVGTFKPFHYLLENDGKDLYLIFKHK